LIAGGITENEGGDEFFLCA